MNRFTVYVCLLALTLFAAAPQVKADLIALEDGNSAVGIDPGTSAGMYSWAVDGTSQLYQQWFWYRVGDAGGQSAINTLSTPTVTLSDTNGDGKNDVANLKYSNSAFEILVKYSLHGGPAGSLQSDVGEQIQINNLSSRAIDNFHFFQYSDFDLNGVPGGQTAQFLAPGKFQQSGEGITLSETVVTPDPSRHEAGTYADTFNALQGGTTYNLNNNDVATGDATWAFQWDFNLAAVGTAGSSFAISKDKLLSPTVPEPASILLMGGILLVVARKFRKA